MKHEQILQAIYDPANRANPYPLFAELQKTPVSWQEDGPNPEGTFVVATYREIAALLHDPRLSSDLSKGEKTRGLEPVIEQRSFIRRDAPEHDVGRARAMRHFGPPHRPEYVEGLRPEIERIARDLVDDLRGESRFDIVARVAYSLPVTVICAILGVPREDQPRFKVWADTLISHGALHTDEARAAVASAREALHGYMAELIELRRRVPRDDMLSRMANDAHDAELAAVGSLLLIAGHETTVNLIANGVLTFLRMPDVLDRLRRDPALVVGAVEELLRFEPPVQMLSNRTSLDDIAIAGATIPKGAQVTLALAAGNRDPARFRDPDCFEPARADNAHLGFGSGIHYCFGAPLARLEAQVALTEILQRLERPRLVVDPPPYRESPVLRGPRELLVEVDGVRRADERPDVVAVPVGM
jgi:cytochrome P450